MHALSFLIPLIKQLGEGFTHLHIVWTKFSHLGTKMNIFLVEYKMAGARMLWYYMSKTHVVTFSISRLLVWEDSERWRTTSLMWTELTISDVAITNNILVRFLPLLSSSTELGIGGIFSVYVLTKERESIWKEKRKKER